MVATLKINLEQKRIFDTLSLINIVFIAFGVSLQIAKYNYNIETPITDLLDLNKELNFPTWYSGILFFLSSVISYVISNLENNKANKNYWLLLSIILLFLSIDEIAAIHERINDLLSMFLTMGGVFHFKWILLYVPLGLGMLATLIPFFRRLDRKLLKFLFLSGIVFVIGAVGLEMVGGNWAESFGQDNLVFSMFSSVEEFLELQGLTIFIYGTLDYISRKQG